MFLLNKEHETRSAITGLFPTVLCASSRRRPAAQICWQWHTDAAHCAATLKEICRYRCVMWRG